MRITFNRSGKRYFHLPPWAQKILISALTGFVFPAAGGAQSMVPRLYDVGNPTLHDLWVNPSGGNDSNSGLARFSAVRTLTAAWERIPAGAALSQTGFRIQLTKGDYPAGSIPEWMDKRHGTSACPVILNSVDGRNAARLHGYLNVHDSSYLYLIGLAILTDRNTGGGGNVVHLDACDHILLRACRLDGFDGQTNQPQETLKANQCRFIHVEDCDIGGGQWMALDFVAVQDGHIVDSKIHDSGDDALVLKGGSARFRVEANEVYNAGSIGLAVGQGTGFEYMISPWLHYEAYDCKLIDNVVHDTANAGAGVRGGYNILIAFNTFYKIGLSAQGAPLFSADHGSRGCDGDENACRIRHDAGGWGPLNAGEKGDWIPNRNVAVYNNIFYNPAPWATVYSHFSFAGPVTPPPGSNIPSPSLADENLRIAGNLIWNGPADHPLGIEPGGGCPADHPGCGETKLRAVNSINAFEPRLIDPGRGNFRPAPGSSIFRATTYAVPDFPGGDRPGRPAVPEGVLSNAVPRDADQNARSSSDPPGAYSRGSSVPRPKGSEFFSSGSPPKDPVDPPNLRKPRDGLMTPLLLDKKPSFVYGIRRSIRKTA